MNDEHTQEVPATDTPILIVPTPVEEEKPKIPKTPKPKVTETVSKEKYDALASAALKVLTQYKTNHRTFNYPGMAELNAILDS